MADKEIGKRLRQLRKSYKIKAEDLAKRVDTSPAHIRLIERGERGTTIARFIQLCDIFHVSLDYLLAGRDAAPHETNEAAVHVLPGILKDHELQSLVSLAKAISASDQTEAETNVLFDAFQTQLEFFRAVKNCK